MLRIKMKIMKNKEKREIGEKTVLLKILQKVQKKKKMPNIIKMPGKL